MKYSLHNHIHPFLSHGGMPVVPVLWTPSTIRQRPTQRWQMKSFPIISVVNLYQYVQKSRELNVDSTALLFFWHERKIFLRFPLSYFTEWNPQPHCCKTSELIKTFCLANVSDQIQLVIQISAIVPKHVLNADVDTFPSVFVQFVVSTVGNCYL
jgi:hypothetical protein